MARTIFDLLFPTADLTGTIGELYTHHKLNIVRLFGRHGKVLRNVYIPKDDGTTSEIDLLFITQKGIFVIESKNFFGWIFGSENQGYWTATLPGQKKQILQSDQAEQNAHQMADEVP